jgi:septum formation protein
MNIMESMLTVKPKTLILASSSPRRQELIRSLKLPCEIMASDVDESTASGLSPAQVVEELSLRKARAVFQRLEARSNPGIVIGSDTIVVLDNHILGKPVDEADAFRMLKSIQGRKHQVYSGVACIDTGSGDEKAGPPVTRPFEIGEPMEKAGDAMYLGDTGQYRILSESPSGQPKAMIGHTVTKVTFRPMSDEEIEAYVKTGEPLDKAGSYGVQGLGSVFIERIEGDFYSVMGLPLNLLYQMLLKFGISPFKSLNI